MKDTFLCPGLVVKMPYRLVGFHIHIVIEYVWGNSVEVRNIRNGIVSMKNVWDIRERGVLVGKNYKVKP